MQDALVYGSNLLAEAIDKQNPSSRELSWEEVLEEIKERICDPLCIASMSASHCSTPSFRGSTLGIGSHARCGSWEDLQKASNPSGTTTASATPTGQSAVLFDNMTFMDKLSELASGLNDLENGTSESHD